MESEAKVAHPEKVVDLMKLLNRYLLAVKSYLPEDQRNDIINELAVNLRAQIEDRERELGHAPDDEEIARILKQHGHPMIVAGRYLPLQHLIGPAMLPVYWYSLKLTMLIAGLVYTVVLAMVPFIARVKQITESTPVPGIIERPGISLIFWVGVLWMLAAFGGVTLVFTLLEHRFHRSQLLGRWDPRTVRPVAKVELKPRSQAIGRLVACVIWTICLVVPQFPFLFGPAGKFLKPTPAFEPFRTVLVVLVAAYAGEAILTLVVPHLTRLCQGVRLMLHSAGMLVLYLLVRAGDLVSLTDAAKLPAAEAQRTSEIINLCFNFALLLTLFILGIFFAMELVKYVRRLKRH